jgi:hypothetical protein
MRERTVARCTCGDVELEMSGAPILSAVCYCDDCQEGARQIGALPNAAAVQDADAGTAYVLYRKDRVTVSRGAALLKPYKIRDKSATNRVVATCCNSAMMVNFDDGKWWVDVYRARIQGDAPPVQAHVCTKFRPGPSGRASDVPSYPGYPFKLIVRLLGSKVAMMLGR